jgi:septal ring factor EnvC (AmiA/AmiB activator)
MSPFAWGFVIASVLWIVAIIFILKNNVPRSMAEIESDIEDIRQENGALKEEIADAENKLIQIKLQMENTKNEKKNDTIDDLYNTIELNI